MASEEPDPWDDETIAYWTQDPPPSHTPPPSRTGNTQNNSDRRSPGHLRPYSPIPDVLPLPPAREGFGSPNKSLLHPPADASQIRVVASSRLVHRRGPASAQPQCQPPRRVQFVNTLASGIWLPRQEQQQHPLRHAPTATGTSSGPRIAADLGEFTPAAIAADLDFREALNCLSSTLGRADAAFDALLSRGHGASSQVSAIINCSRALHVMIATFLANNHGSLQPPRP